MLERGLIPRPRRQHHDPRIIRAAGRLFQRQPQRAEERRQPVHLRIAIQARDHPLDHGPVLQRVAGARRRLGAIGHHDRTAVGVAPDVGGVGEQLLSAGQPDPVRRAQEAVGSEHELGRQQLLGQQLPRTVEVLEDHAQQLRAFDHTALDRLPFAAADQRRHRIQLPAGGRVVVVAAVAVDVVGDAVLLQQPPRLLLAAQQLRDADLGQRLRHERPLAADRSGVVEELVPAARQWRVARSCE